MQLKYQSEIDNLKLSINCPGNLDEIEGEMDAYRFCRDPIDVSKDFLPNVVYDRLMGITICDYSENNPNHEEKCGRCGASFNKKISKLVSSWDNMSLQNRAKFGYNAVAIGKLNKGDGVIRLGKSGHIGLYEYVGATFHASFKIERILM